jgi:hypothetical protein
MAIAVEHQAKAFLCSISGALLADKLDVDDLVLLTGNQDRVVSRRLADVKTISASAAHDRVAKLRRQKGAADALGELREARNGITHLGAWEARDVRRILAAGITYIDDLLADADRDRADFWGRYATLAAGLVDQAKDQAELRYENKLDRARRRFEERFGGMPEEERATATTAVASSPPRAGLGLWVPIKCPACHSPAWMSGRDYSEDWLDAGAEQVWFDPRFFGCRACGLTLDGPPELKLADMTVRLLVDEEDKPPPDWEPDPAWFDE